MVETTTIEVTNEQKAQLDDFKDHGKEPYKSVISRLIANYNGDAIDSHSNAMESHNESIDYERLGSLLDDRLQHHLSEWEITVNLDQLDLDPVGMDEKDVENIVERYLEKNIDQLRKGHI